MKGFDRRRFLELIGIGAPAAAATSAGVGVAACAAEVEEGDEALLVAADTFEYIVVGSGAGGGPLAANLARQGHKVLLLEAGTDRGQSVEYRVPAMHTQSTEDPDMRWDFFVKHYDDAVQQAKDTKNTAKGVLYPRAGTLGGCTSHNAMITVYPHESDWDGIAAVTSDASWKAANMRKYFQILERCGYLDNGSAGHGFAGWLNVHRTDPTVGLRDAKILKIVTAAALAFSKGATSNFISALLSDVKELVGIVKRDLNAPGAARDQAEGLFGVPLAVTDKARRNGPREYILSTIAQKKPLTLKMNCLASRVLWGAKKESAGWRAIGIEYLEGAHLYRADPKAPAVGQGGVKKVAKATREVILCGGAFNTPQLLLLSGVGPKADLAAAKVPLKVDLPGVGRNLQDRYEVGVVCEAGSEFSLIEDCTFTGSQPDPCLTDWRNGANDTVYASNGAVVGVVKKSTPDKAVPDLFIFGVGGFFKGYFPGYSKEVTKTKRHFTWAVLKAHTENRGGFIKLKSVDPRDMPDIRFRYFHEGTRTNGADAKDLDAVVAGVEFVRDINKTSRQLMVFQKYAETLPGPAVQTREQIAQFVKNEAWGHHASCTCPMGAASDPNAVLDSKFRVRGTVGLRVVDASVFPRIPGFFIVVPVYMVSEKATDDILASIGETRKFTA